MEWRNHPAELMIQESEKVLKQRLQGAASATSVFGSFVAMTKEQRVLFGPSTLFSTTLFFHPRTFFLG